MASAKRQGRDGAPAGDQPAAAVMFTLADLEKEVEKRVADAMEEHFGGLPPRRLPDGSSNLAYFQERFHRINRKAEVAMNRGGALPQGYQQLLKGFEREVELSGWSMQDVMDARSHAQRESDALLNLFAKPLETLLEEADATLTSIRDRMLLLVNLADEKIKERQAELDEAAEERSRGSAAGPKAWVARLNLALQLREWARNPVPKSCDHSKSTAWRATKTGRLMLFVYRSDIPGEDPIFDIGPHHAKMFIDLWEARQCVKFYAKGDPHHPQGGAKMGVTDCNGCILICPPRHTKTSIGAAFIVEEIDQEPRLMCKLTHAIEEKAFANKVYVAQAFAMGTKDETDVSRRNNALYPGLRMKSNNAGKMRLTASASAKDPTLEAAGVSGAVSGGNADIVWPDDPVDRKVVEQATEREKNHKDLTQKWMTRFQGKRWFLLITATIWHEDDTVARLIGQCERRLLNFAVSIQRVGGPDTTPRFFSIWDKYPPKRLMGIFAGMQDPLGWACQFQADPRQRHLLIVRRLALYLSRIEPGAIATEQHLAELKSHLRFRATCRKYMSMDPAALANSKSDKASLLWAGAGDVERFEKNGDVTIHRRVKRLRILDAWEFNANQIDGVGQLKMQAIVNPTDEVIIEGVSAGATSGEMLRREFPGVTIHIFHPQTGAGRSVDKPGRLKMVAGMVDDAMRDVGCRPPVVEFPGVLMPDGSIVPEPRLKAMFDQINYAGKMTADHFLDGFTQLCLTLQHEFPPGEGEFTQQITAAKKKAYDPRPAFLPKPQIMPGPRNKQASAAAEEMVFMCS